MVTAPLGVLKRDLIRFDPPLPPEKQQAIQRLGYGVLNKVRLRLLTLKQYMPVYASYHA